MATLLDISQNLIPQQYFHIFNRGINGQTIFCRKNNYNYFLKKYAKYTKSYFNTLAYCLIPNHFHFLIQVKNTEEILLAAQEDYTFIPKTLEKELIGKGLLKKPIVTKVNEVPYLPFYHITQHSNIETQTYSASWIVSNQLRKLFLGYVKAINKQEKRNGSLIQKPFRRKWVDNESYLIWLIWYIHRNPMHHNLTDNYKYYKHSSFQSYISRGITLLKREQVYDFFQDKSNFIQFHERAAKDWEEWQQYIIEE